MQLKDAPKQLLVECADPVALPNTSLEQAQVEALWAEDRQRLTQCKGKDNAKTKFYLNRDKALRGN